MVKIKLNSEECLMQFVNICSSYDCDINIYIEKTIIDAKSIVGVFAITPGKIMEVQAMTTDRSVISSFIEDMRKFEVEV